MPKNVELLLTENVESLGIVGDVVKVRTGYARNFLLPRSLATKPSEAMIKAVAAKRAEAQKQLAELRKQREAVIAKLQGIEVEMIRSCNDLGHLYAAITQQEIAKALNDKGYSAVRPRDVRLNVNMKRIDTYDVHIKFEADLDATIKVHVKADRKLDIERAREEQEAAEAAAQEAAAKDPGTQLEAATAKEDKPKKAKKDAEPKAAAADKPAKEKKAKA